MNILYLISYRSTWLKHNFHKLGNIGHAILTIGHEKISDNTIDTCQPCHFSDDQLKTSFQNKNITVYDYDELEKRFIFIDDNQPAYQIASLDHPAAHYFNPAWHTCKITYFVAPLYPKIYLEAFEAKKFVLNFLVSDYVRLNDNTEVLIRFFLASTRSFKDRIAVNENLHSDVKNIILSAMMPKFIWVAELSSKDLLKQKLANGILIIDATEANTNWFKPLILAVYQNKYIYHDQNGNLLINNLFTLQNFYIFENNLHIF